MFFKMEQDNILPQQGSIFTWLGKLFKERMVTPILVGGYAVLAYKVERSTFDIDFMLTIEQWSKIENDMLAAGYSYINKSDSFIQLKNKQQQLRDLDFILCDNNTFVKILKDSKTTTIAGSNFLLASPLHLIAMKLHAISQNPQREFKDFNDIIQLIVINKIDIRNKDIEKLFSRYSSDLYQKLLTQTVKL
ncbi:MAG: nucleotidyltransferase [Fibrobacteres bacterium]|nr:nucleotidyltransferase [Fibrobacterota bacterium]